VHSHHYVRSVAEFHAKHDAPIGCAVKTANLWGQDAGILRASLIYEEAGEILLAIHDKDELELVDGLGDLLYVMAGAYVALYGSIYEHEVDLALGRFGGIQADPLWSPNSINVIRNNVALCVETANKLHIDPSERVLAQGIWAGERVLAVCGYDPKAVFDEIHKSNMTKTPTKGDIRVRVKGSDYRAPDLTRFLRGA
jgi:predicted HAD superfamily Cof-like phosphohydrolase